MRAAEVRRVAREVLERLGFPPDHASIVAESLVWADLRGTESHGVVRLPTYVARVDDGTVNPRPHLQVDHTRLATAVVAADGAQGQVAFDLAARTAAELADRSGVGWVLVRDATHFGAAGWFAQRLARDGYAALVLGASRPGMAYHGSRAEAVATNPLAMAVPGGDGHVLLLDMATSTVSRGRLQQHRATGAPLEEGWALDTDGRPTTDPDRAAFPTAAAGAKGAGMSLLFECFGAVLGGAPLVAPTLGGALDRHRQGGAVVALDVGAFTDRDLFLAHVDELVGAIHGLPPAEGIDQVRVPGERGDRTAMEREHHGIPIPERTWERLSGLAGRFGVSLPDSVARP